MWYPNRLVTVKRLAVVSWISSYTTTIVTDLNVYIYETSDEYDAINWVEWWQVENKMLTRYDWIIVWDKIIDENNVEYIVKRIRYRNSFVNKHYEIILQREQD